MLAQGKVKIDCRVFRVVIRFFTKLKPIIDRPLITRRIVAISFNNSEES